MSSTIVEQDFPFDIVKRGSSDAGRHNRRVKEAARKQLKDIISQEEIITSDGNKKVRVRLKNLIQYRFTGYRHHVKDIGRDEDNVLSEGEIIYQPGEGGAAGKGSEPGDQPGEEIYEAEFTIEELTKMMAEELELPDLEEINKYEISAEALDWTDRRRAHGIEACINKRKTLLSNILRRAKSKAVETKHRVGSIIKDDLIYKTYEVTVERHSNAVIFLQLDRSGSMWQDKIYVTKALYFWIVQFLRMKYEKVEIVFIAHDYGARILTEKEFFTIAESGGTRVSAAYELCLEQIKQKYNPTIWNIYCFHASDGGTWGDEEKCSNLAKEIIDAGAKLFAYAEIDMGWGSGGGESRLMEFLKEAANSKSAILTATIQSRENILSAIKAFLAKDTSEATP